MEMWDVLARLFLNALNKSIKTAPLFLVIFLLRLLMKRAPKKDRILLWGITALGLILPVWRIPSPLTLTLRAEPVSPRIVYAAKPEIETGVSFVDSAVNSALTVLAPHNAVMLDNGTVLSEDSVNPMQLAAWFASLIWAVGIGGMLLYMLISTFRLKLRLRGAEKEQSKTRVFRSCAVSTPFILGVLCPRIYLPESLPETDRSAVLQHEQAHLKRRDPLWKLIGFLLLAYYWFNPLVWLGYAMLCKDIEFACDERVISKLNAEEKKCYAESLLRCSLPQSFSAKCPLAFGEVAVKARIASVAAYRKPVWWKRAAALLTVPVLAVCFLTDPLNAGYVPEHAVFQSAILENVPSPHSVHTVCEYVILDQAFEPFYDRRGISYHYAAVLEQDFVLENGEPICQGEHFTTAYIAFKQDWLLKYIDLEQCRTAPRYDGEYEAAADTVHLRFPSVDLNDTAWRGNYDALAESCLAQAKAYFSQ